MTKSEKIQKLLENPDELAIRILFLKLQEAGIPCEFNDRSQPLAGIFRYQICYPDIEHQKADVIQAYYNMGVASEICLEDLSYGAEENLLEAYGFDDLWGDVKGWLSVDEAFEMFKRQYYGKDTNEETLH